MPDSTPYVPVRAENDFATVARLKRFRSMAVALGLGAGGALVVALPGTLALIAGSACAIAGVGIFTIASSALDRLGERTQHAVADTVKWWADAHDCQYDHDVHEKRSTVWLTDDARALVIARPAHAGVVWAHERMPMRFRLKPPPTYEKDAWTELTSSAEPLRMFVRLVPRHSDGLPVEGWLPGRMEENLRHVLTAARSQPDGKLAFRRVAISDHTTSRIHQHLDAVHELSHLWRLLESFPVSHRLSASFRQMNEERRIQLLEAWRNQVTDALKPGLLRWAETGEGPSRARAASYLDREPRCAALEAILESNDAVPETRGHALAALIHFEEDTAFAWLESAARSSAPTVPARPGSIGWPWDESFPRRIAGLEPHPSNAAQLISWLAASPDSAPEDLLHWVELAARAEYPLAAETLERWAPRVGRRKVLRAMEKAADTIRATLEAIRDSKRGGLTVTGMGEAGNVSLTHD